VEEEAFFLSFLSSFALQRRAGKGRGGGGIRFRGGPGRGRGGGGCGGRTEGGGGGALALVFVFRSCTAPRLTWAALKPSGLPLGSS